MATKPHEPKGDTEAYAKTRILLALWDMGGAEAEVKKGELTRRVGRSKNGGSYQDLLKQLEDEGAIALSKTKVNLSAKGVETLTQHFQNPDFEFNAQIGAKTANALLKWIRQMGTITDGTTAPATTTQKQIASYEDFKAIALDVYDQLNRDYNLDDLVPIYRMRREIGEQVTREHFNEWLLEMQENDILQLQGGSLPDNDPAKIEDSITTAISGLRCYAKRLNT